MRSCCKVASLPYAEAFAPSLLPATIGAFFAFRVLDVLLAVRVFGQDASAGVGAALVLNWMLFVLVAFHSLGPARRSLWSMQQIPCSRWVLAFLGLTGISLLWSNTASLTAAAAFWSAMVADTAMLVLLLRSGPLNAVVNAAMRGYVSGACLVAVIAWILPAQRDLRLGDEELLGPNQIGYVCAFAIFFAQYLMQQKNGNWIPHAVLLAVTLLRCLSKTTIIALAAGQVYILFSDRSISRKSKWVLICSVAVVLLLFWGLLSDYFNVYINAGNQAETLTGRVGIWAYFLNESLDHPWLGHGFHSVWKVVPPFGPDQFEARHAHNELLQQFYAYGVLGVGVTAAVYGSVFLHLRRLARGPMRSLFIGMLLFTVIRGFADTEAFDLSLPMWTIVMLGYLIERGPTRDEVWA